jgi:uncharacterized membrane protein
MRMAATIELLVLLLTIFVVIPSIAAAIGYAAWTGRPKNWDRAMYWTAFVTSIIAAGLLLGSGIGMRADVRTWHYLIQIVLFGLGAVLFGVAGGCMVGVFTYRLGKGPIWQEATPQQEHSTDNPESGK